MLKQVTAAWVASPDILRLIAGWLMSIILENEETSVSVFVCHFVLCVIRKCFDGIGSLSVCTSHFVFTAGCRSNFFLN